MKSWIVTIKYYLRQFIELGLLLIGVSVFAEILFGPDVAFFGSQVTANLITLLNSLTFFLRVFFISQFSCIPAG